MSIKLSAWLPSIFLTFVLIGFFAANSSCMSVSYSYHDESGSISDSQNYNLDASTSMKSTSIFEGSNMEQTILANGKGQNSLGQQIKGNLYSFENTLSSSGSFGISSSAGASSAAASLSQDVSGLGESTLGQSVAGEGYALQNSVTNSGSLSDSGSFSASSDSVSLSQNVNAIGESKVSILGSTGSSSSSQESGVLKGTLASFQDLSVQDKEVSSSQATRIFGALGYSTGEAQSSQNKVQVDAGLNGIGALNSQMATSTSGGVSASSAIQADSLTSKAYSTSRAISPEVDVYSYLSSSNYLNSDANAKANEHVSTEQNLNTVGNVLAYASAKDVSGFNSYTGEGNVASGRLYAESSAKSIGNNLAGDIQSIPSGPAPQGGNYVWQSFGGYITSNPYSIVDNQGRVHTFAVGGDQGLWDNIAGDWFGLGGHLTSDPYAAKDSQGRLNILARGGDGGLWDKIFDTSTGSNYWIGLGGYITSAPTAAVEPYQNGFLKIMARGGDNALWERDLNAIDLSGGWYRPGGVITSTPYILFDNQNNMQTFARGADGALWVCKSVLNGNMYGADWYRLGGYITSDAKPVIDPANANWIDVFARGGDGGLWCESLNTQSQTGEWSGFGGYISPAGSGSPIYSGNPEPIVDPMNNNLNVFVRGGDGALWNLYFNQGSTNWYTLGGYITSNPTATKDANIEYVNARGGDNALWGPHS